MGEKRVYNSMLHSCNVLEGRIVFPAQTEKPQYFVVKDESKKNVMENQNTVFLKKRRQKKKNADYSQPCI